MKKEGKDQKLSHQSIQPPPGMAQEFLGKEGMCSHPTPSSVLLHDDMQVLADQFMDLGTDRLWSQSLASPVICYDLKRSKLPAFLRPHERAALVMGAQNSGLAPNLPKSVTGMSTHSVGNLVAFQCLHSMLWAAEGGHTTALHTLRCLSLFPSVKDVFCKQFQAGFPTKRH